MAFPSTALLDDFTRANSGSSAGANWTMSQQLFGISSNALYNATGSGYSIGYWNPITPGPDSEAYATYSTLGNSGNEVSLWVRMTNPVVANFTCYGITHTAVTNTFRIRKFVNGTGTDLTTQTLTLAAGDRLGVEVIGTTLRAYKYTAGAWSQVATVTDSSISAAGRVGATIQNGSARLDDFSGGTVVSGGTPITGSDSAALTESTPVLLAANGVTDSAALAESSALVIAQDVAGTDSATLTEISALVIAQDVAGTDSAALTEISALVIAQDVASTDSATLTEISALVIAQDVAGSDSAALSEVAPVLFAANGVTDSAALTEAAALMIAQDVAGTDDATLTEDSALVIDSPAVSVIVDNVMLAMR